MKGLVDIGANLTNKSFHPDFDAVLERAKNAGVETILVTGTSVQGSLEAREIASRKGAPVRLFSTAGIHPHHASSFGPLALETLRETLAGDRVVAVGECGLDFNRNYSPKTAQLACFEAQLKLAAEIQKPLFLHERDAHEDFYALVREHRKHLAGGVVHCFTGGRTALERYLELDLHIGITGWVSDVRRGRDLFALVRDIPPDRLMIETDAPYLLPAGARPNVPRRNEPSLLPHVLRAVAQARGENDDDVARRTTETACRLFGL
jgi:TatD DNase family protein